MQLNQDEELVQAGLSNDSNVGITGFEWTNSDSEDEQQQPQGPQ